MKKYIILLSAVFLIAASCNRTCKKTDDGFIALDTLVKQVNFQKEVDGKKVDLFTLKNDSGTVIKITNFGARIVSVLLPDKNRKYVDISVGLPSIDQYLADKTFAGSIVGRFANRISKGKFKLDKKEYNLPINSGVNSLHGGKKGFDKVVWDARQNNDTLYLKYTAADMEEGYPGKLIVEVTYILTNNNELKIEFSAVTDKKTIINLAGHGYFNLKGEGNGDILSHELEIFGDKTTPVDSNLIPTGEIADVKNTPFDFTAPHTVGERIKEVNQQLKFGFGYDHNWVLNNQSGVLALAARVTEPETGIVFEIFSSEPGIQFYSGNFMNGTMIGKSGKPINYRNVLALEPQHYPDSPNHQNFPSTILEPGKTFKSETIYKFSIKK
jgi:aldose 1-epimerase